MPSCSDHGFHPSNPVQSNAPALRRTFHFCRISVDVDDAKVWHQLESHLVLTEPAMQQPERTFWNLRLQINPEYTVSVQCSFLKGFGICNKISVPKFFMGLCWEKNSHQSSQILFKNMEI